MANQLQKFNGEITTGLDLDLLWSILQNTGTGGGFDFNLLTKEETLILATQILQSQVIATQATNTQLASNIVTEVNAINTVKAAVDLLRGSNSAENNNLLTVLNNILIRLNADAESTQVINTYNVVNNNLIVSSGATNSASTYKGIRKKMVLRVASGNITVVAGNPAGINFQFWQMQNRNNLQTTMNTGLWVCDTVPDFFSIIASGGGNCTLTLYP